jgi:hypothetical protein
MKFKDKEFLTEAERIEVKNDLNRIKNSLYYKFLINGDINPKERIKPLCEELLEYYKSIEDYEKCENLRKLIENNNIN